MSPITRRHPSNVAATIAIELAALGPDNQLSCGSRVRPWDLGADDSRTLLDNSRRGPLAGLKKCV